jgi:hypothetical protein
MRDERGSAGDVRFAHAASECLGSPPGGPIEKIICVDEPVFHGLCLDLSVATLVPPVFSAIPPDISQIFFISRGPDRVSYFIFLPYLYYYFV